MYPALLLPRKIRHGLHSNSSTICPATDESGPPIVNFVGNLTYHQFSVILSGSCAILSTLIVFALIGSHAIHYSNPVQQRQIIRICLLVPWVALWSFLIVWQDNVGEYLVESLDFGCAIALSSFLLFMCDLVLSHPGGFDDLFGPGAQPDRTRGKDSPISLRVSFHEPPPALSQLTCVAAYVVRCFTIHTHLTHPMDRNRRDSRNRNVLQGVQQHALRAYLGHCAESRLRYHSYRELFEILQAEQGQTVTAQDPAQTLYFQGYHWTQLPPDCKTTQPRYDETIC
jgi:hypothetical protein